MEGGHQLEDGRNDYYNGDREEYIDTQPINYPHDVIYEDDDFDEPVGMDGMYTQEQTIDGGYNSSRRNNGNSADEDVPLSMEETPSRGDRHSKTKRKKASARSKSGKPTSREKDKKQSKSHVTKSSSSKRNKSYRSGKSTSAKRKRLSTVKLSIAIVCLAIMVVAVAVVIYFLVGNNNNKGPNENGIGSANINKPKQTTVNNDPDANENAISQSPTPGPKVDGSNGGTPQVLKPPSPSNSMPSTNGATPQVITIPTMSKTTRRPTPFLTFYPTPRTTRGQYTDTWFPTPIMDNTQIPDLCPTVQQYIGGCAPLVPSTTISDGSGNGNGELCPTFQAFVGSCGTPWPTVVPATFSPVVSVPTEMQCTPEKFQDKVFINEFHYRNAGFDFAEFVEIAHPIDLDLSGYFLEFYSGEAGKVYKVYSLGSELPAVQSVDPNGNYVLFSAYSQVNFHNGPAGVAIINPDGVALQFISYGGNFTATNGGANGMSSQDVGVTEPESSPLTFSLQLKGTGGRPEDFYWDQPKYGTPGKVNDGQVMWCS